MKPRLARLLVSALVGVAAGYPGIAAADRVAPAEAARQLLDFGEATFNGFFPSHEPTLTYAPFLFRFYPATGVALGVVVVDGMGYAYRGVYALGGPFGAQPQYAGLLDTYVQTSRSGGVHISAGADFSLALGRNGVLQTWGSDALEALGNGAAAQGRSQPGPTTSNTFFDTIASHPASSFGLAIERTTGRVLGWGDNSAGQLGDGSSTTRADPVPMRDSAAAELSGAVAVAAGAGFSLVLRSDGSVLASGRNDHGQLGDGTTVSRQSAAPVPAVCGDGGAVQAIAAGADFALALCADNSLRAWGANAQGQLGDGTQVDRLQPVRVPAPSASAIVAIAAGAEFALALDAAGDVWSWGDNRSGQLGTDLRAFPQRSTPGRVPGFVGAIAIAAGPEHAMAVLVSGTVYAWGSNASGQLGPNAEGAPRVEFSISVGGLPAIVDVAAGAGHSLAVDHGGVLWAWGRNGSGQLGNGGSVSSSTPTSVSGLSLDRTAAAAPGRPAVRRADSRPRSR